MDSIYPGRNSMRYFVFILSFVIVCTEPSEACTAFCINNGKQIILAKNLDWSINDGLIFLNKRGIYKTTYTDFDKKISWISKYGSITFNQFGKEFPLGGMNETGLVIEELNSWGETPNSDTACKINEFQWVQFCLDNFSTVEEIIKNEYALEIDPLFLNLHYLVCDKQGHLAIIEFFDGKTHLYHDGDIKYPVLSNNRYKSSLNYIKNFQGFGGELAIRDEKTSNERFVKAASLIKYLDSTDYEAVLPGAFKILGAVSQEDTQWSIVYDITNSSIHFKTAESNKKKIIDLAAFHMQVAYSHLQCQFRELQSYK